MYGTDGFYPTLEGSYLAALVKYGRLSGRFPVGLPARFALPNRAVREIPAPMAVLLQKAAAAALANRR